MAARFLYMKTKFKGKILIRMRKDAGNPRAVLLSLAETIQTRGIDRESDEIYNAIKRHKDTNVEMESGVPKVFRIVSESRRVSKSLKDLYGRTPSKTYTKKKRS